LNLCFLIAANQQIAAVQSMLSDYGSVMPKEYVECVEEFLRSISTIRKDREKIDALTKADISYIQQMTEESFLCNRQALSLGSAVRSTMSSTNSREQESLPDIYSSLHSFKKAKIPLVSLSENRLDLKQIPSGRVESNPV
jgi:hypothetical protein